MSSRAAFFAVASAFACAALVVYLASLPVPARSPSAPPLDLGTALVSAPAAAPDAPAVAAVAPAAPQVPTARAKPTAVELEAAGAILSAVLVNIICVAPPASGVQSISGGGVIVAPAGYVLTNAHIAEYFLLADRGVACTLRAGAPARPAYQAELAYLPAAWMRDNAGVIAQPTPLGTGERDFALLAITASRAHAELPTRFPYVALARAESRAETPVVIGTYGAQALSTQQIESSLVPTIVAGSVEGVLTFGTSTVDFLALGGSVAAQEGSSGGGVLGFDGTLSGLVTTSTATGPYASRELSAISAPYIRREYMAQTGEPLDTLLSRAPAEAVALFVPQARTLEAQYLSTLLPKR